MEKKKIMLGEAARKAREEKQRQKENEETIEHKIKTVTRPQGNLLPKKEVSFDERYNRITTYLESSLHETVMGLKRNKEISSITDLVNIALKDYLKKCGLNL